MEKQINVSLNCDLMCEPRVSGGDEYLYNEFLCGRIFSEIFTMSEKKLDDNINGHLKIITGVHQVADKLWVLDFYDITKNVKELYEVTIVQLDFLVSVVFNDKHMNKYNKISSFHNVKGIM